MYQPAQSNEFFLNVGTPTTHGCSEVVASYYYDNVYIIQPGASLFENPTLYFVNSGKIEC